ncbi:MAG: DUF3120 domain-containing protein [Leptolyngbyaceae cyanobacterium SL_1_1]|nr:DUF3120 domain-containing protein [Leptolyngbyaceae cyanobacterium RM2_2_21]NJN02197.1 DUF3120 domain-containing protein [Leptolyngbyaceae cyanobacterium RM1_1_2]NJO10350.1 DUF3120 domain-containing protein [Leptolyngbyaceae cyanobacterium SL_1_1]
MSYYSLPTSYRPLPTASPLLQRLAQVPQRWQVFAAAVFLVVVPVFFQAPLVRLLPWFSLLISGLWFFIGVSLLLLKSPLTKLWGDLLVGFTWTWLAGSIYWGWLRWEPLIHLPVEAIGLPVALLCVLTRRGLVGSYFYLGSLFGTAITDLYFYWTDLIPYWSKLMRQPPDQAASTLHAALEQLQTVEGVSQAILLLWVLVICGCLPLVLSRKLHWWAFGGAVLSTIFVDSLFLLVAAIA